MMRWFDKEHVNCKDPNCLSKIENVDDWDRLFFGESGDAPIGYSPCCGVCGCCPCGSYRCYWCRGDKWPFNWWRSLLWKLYGERRWERFMKERTNK